MPRVLRGDPVPMEWTNWLLRDWLAGGFHLRMDARRIYLYYLPPYSPELNDAERLFRHVKHHELPERAYTPFAALEQAVDAAFTRCEEKLWLKHQIQPRLAA